MVSTATTSAFQANVFARPISCSRACGVVSSVPTLAIGETTTRPIPMPQPRMATPWSWRDFRKTFLRHIPGLPGTQAVALVVAQEDVLQARLVTAQRDHRVVGRRLDHRVRRALPRAPQGTAAGPLL